jgi:hypothetical protein
MPESFEGFAAPCCTDGSCFADFSTSVFSPAAPSFGGDALLSSRSAMPESLSLNTSSLYGAEARTASPLDAGKSVHQQVSEGNFRQSDKAAPEHRELNKGDQPKITVTSDTSRPADFTVKSDGTVEVHGNPEDGGKLLSEYKIAVEPGAGEKATDALVTYLSDRLSAAGENIKPVLDAQPGLVSDEVRQSFNVDDKTDSEEDLENDNRNNNGGGGCNNGGGGRNNGGRDNGGDDLPDENKDDSRDDNKDSNRDGNNKTEQVSNLDAMRNALVAASDAAGNPNWDNATAGSLGAYSMNAVSWFSSFLTSEMLEELEEIDPKTGKKVVNFKKLGQVMNKHKKDPRFQAQLQERTDALKAQGDEGSASTLNSLADRLGSDSKYAEGFGSFLQNQSENKNATPEELKNFFNKDIQQSAISSQMADAAGKLNIKVRDMNEKQAGDLALAMTLGNQVKRMDSPALQAQMETMRKDPLYQSYLEESIYKFRKARKNQK